MTRHEEYDEFMKQYNLLHECCPKCGETSYMTTLVEYVLDLCKKEEYKDLNRCTCGSCGDVHTIHDRVPKKDKQKIQEKINAIIELAKTKGTKVDWSKQKPIEDSLSKVIKTQEQADFFMMCLNALCNKK